MAPAGTVELTVYVVVQVASAVRLASESVFSQPVYVGVGAGMSGSP